MNETVDDFCGGCDTQVMKRKASNINKVIIIIITIVCYAVFPRHGTGSTPLASTQLYSLLVKGTLFSTADSSPSA